MQTQMLTNGLTDRWTDIFNIGFGIRSNSFPTRYIAKWNACHEGIAHFTQMNASKVFGSSKRNLCIDRYRSNFKIWRSLSTLKYCTHTILPDYQSKIGIRLLTTRFVGLSYQLLVTPEQNAYEELFKFLIILNEYEFLSRRGMGNR